MNSDDAETGRTRCLNLIDEADGHVHRGDHVAARRCLEEAVAIADSHGLRTDGVPTALRLAARLGWTAVRLRDLDGAAQYYRKVADSDESDPEELAFAARKLAGISLSRGGVDEALRYYRRSAAYASWEYARWAEFNLAFLEALEGNRDSADQFLARAIDKGLPPEAKEVRQVLRYLRSARRIGRPGGIGRRTGRLWRTSYADVTEGRRLAFDPDELTMINAMAGNIPIVGKTYDHGLGSDGKYQIHYHI